MRMFPQNDTWHSTGDSDPAATAHRSSCARECADKQEIMILSKIDFLEFAKSAT